jgi:uncharacterized protein (TIGR02300 family)
MTKPELGTKRLCAECGARYYDLNTIPIACPKCGTRFKVVETKTSPHSSQPAAARQPTVAPQKSELTSPEPKDTLIEELDEDDADVSELIAGKDDESQQDSR